MSVQFGPPKEHGLNGHGRRGGVGPPVKTRKTTIEFIDYWLDFDRKPRIEKRVFESVHRKEFVGNCWKRCVERRYRWPRRRGRGDERKSAVEMLGSRRLARVRRPRHGCFGRLIDDERCFFSKYERGHANRPNAGYYYVCSSNLKSVILHRLRE